ncbi:DUF6708 domain-containing protein [Rahnella contaminans]|uniref:DUF6708 domain-containing protein n=1 Tax=Rahnella contaminans TaxID=2703882 RepID=UPI003C2DA0AF
MSRKHPKQKTISTATPEEIQAVTVEHFSREPVLTPPLKNWEEDLPENNTKQTVPGKLLRVTEINDTWMEIPRYENIMWGGAWLGVIALTVPLLMLVYMFIAVIFTPNSNYLSKDDLVFLATLGCGGGIVLSMIILNLRMALFVPRDQPIRFNRKRQKIYIFDYHRKAWNPWVKWPATVKVFDWADVHGEISRESDRYAQGFRLYGSVCQPGTHNVIDRFVLNWAIFYIEPQRQLWSHCCQYMQHQPVIMDPIEPGRPDNWKPRKNMCWPVDLEMESTTDPDTTQG